MTKYCGQLSKMAVRADSPVQYSFVLDNSSDSPSVNSFLNKKLKVKFTGKIKCIGCGRAIKKSYQQGYCFPCTQSLAACDFCILKPERCHYEQGTCREPEWGLKHCFVPHIVYLADSSGVKVGLTRETQVPIRWIDQGAAKALPILRVQSRWQAGLLEVAFAEKVADKTDWRKMLRGPNGEADLQATRDKLFGELATDVQEIAGKFSLGDIEILTNESVQTFEYPVLEYPQKISSLNLDKTPEIEGILKGVKGQYLIFEHGVINIRKYTGYEVEIEG